MTESNIVNFPAPRQSPIITDITPSSFTMQDDGTVAVNLPTNGDPIEFTIALDQLMVMITGMVLFANANLSQVFDAIGAP